MDDPQSRLAGVQSFSFGCRRSRGDGSCSSWELVVLRSSVAILAVPLVFACARIELPTVPLSNSLALHQSIPCEQVSFKSMCKTS